MVEIALIPLLGVLALFGVSVFVLNCRSARIAAAKTEVERTMASILRGDRENDIALVESIVAGGSIDQCLSRFGVARMKLFPAAHTEDAAWSAEALESWKQRKVAEQIEAVNRRLALPAFGSAIAILAVCIVAVGVLYSFRSSQSSPAIPLSGPAVPGLESSAGSDTVNSPGPAQLLPLEPLPLSDEAPEVLSPLPTNDSPAPNREPLSPTPASPTPPVNDPAEPPLPEADELARRLAIHFTETYATVVSSFLLC